MVAGMSDSTNGIDRSFLTAAIERHAAIQERLQKAREVQIAATGAVRGAEAKVAQAVARVAAGEATPDASVMRSVTDARAQAQFHEQLVNELERLEQEARAAIQDAAHQSFVGEYEAGKGMRLAAAEKADEARAMLEEAETEHKAGSRMLMSAFQSGARHPTNTSMSEPWGKGLTNANGAPWLGSGASMAEAERTMWETE